MEAAVRVCETLAGTPSLSISFGGNENTFNIRYFGLFILCFVIQLKSINRTLVKLNLQHFFYMFHVMKLHHQEVRYRIQALC